MSRAAGSEESNGAARPWDPAEAELVERLREHDETAVRQIYRLHADGIYRYALYQGSDPALAEDIVAEVFVRMMESMKSYEYRGFPISAWLFRIARNLVVDQQRRGGRVTALDDSHAARLISEDPLSLAERRLSWDELRDGLSELTEEQRQVIVLKFVEDLDNQEVARIVGKSEGSVKSLQHRALRSLRRILERQANRV